MLCFWFPAQSLRVVVARVLEYSESCLQSEYVWYDWMNNEADGATATTTALLYPHPNQPAFVGPLLRWRF